MSEENAPSPNNRRFKFRQAILSDVGLKRDENQDSHGYAHTSRASIYVVADGMGGARGGATASAAAVDQILRSVFNADGDITPSTIQEAIEHANEVIFNESQKSESLTGMGTTVVLLAFSGESVIVSHVGDSRAYRYREGKLERLSRDHTLVQELLDTGAITADEAAKHPIAHMLTRSLGPTPAVEVECVLLPSPVAPRDRFLICCDGLYNVVTDEEIGNLLSGEDLEAIADLLLKLALERGAPDNVTIQLIEAFDVNDESVTVSLPDPGKVRVMTSAAEEETAVVPLAAEEMKRKPKNALEEVILAQDIEERERREAEKRSAKKLTEGPAEGKEEEEEEEEVEELEPEEPEPSVEEVRVLRRVQVIAALVVCGAVIVVLLLFLARGRERPTRRYASFQTTTTVVLPTAAPTAVPTAAEPTTPPAADSGAEVPAVGDWTAISIVPSGAPTLEPTATVAVIETTSTPAPGPETTQQTWPEVSITEQVLSGEMRQKLTQAAQEKWERAARVIEIALSTAVPEPRKLRQDLGSPTVVDPINWQEEQSAVSSMMSAGEAQFLTDEEKRSVAARKAQLRDWITDIDVKMQALDAFSGRELSEQQRLLGKQVEAAQEAQVLIGQELENVKQEYRRWMDRKQSLSNTNALRFADEIAGQDDDVQRRSAEYQAVLTRYQGALTEYQANPRDPSLVPQLAELGRDLKAKRTYLEEAVVRGIDRGISETMNGLATKAFMVDALNRLIERTNRHLGFVRGAQPNSDGRNTRLLQTLLGDRAKYVAELTALRLRFSDGDEGEFRRQEALRNLNFARAVAP